MLGQLGPHQLILQQCGIGKVNSAIGTVEMIHAYNPELIISTGVAGGADVNLNVTEVVVSTACCYHDVYCGSECEPGQVLGQPQRFDTPSSLHQKATGMKSETPVHSGLIVTGDWFVDSKEKMQSILNQFPEAKAVDMESASIAHTCHSICVVPNCQRHTFKRHRRIAILRFLGTFGQWLIRSYQAILIELITCRGFHASQTIFTRN